MREHLSQRSSRRVDAADGRRIARRTSIPHMGTTTAAGVTAAARSRARNQHPALHAARSWPRIATGAKGARAASATGRSSTRGSTRSPRRSSRRALRAYGLRATSGPPGIPQPLDEAAWRDAGRRRGDGRAALHRHARQPDHVFPPADPAGIGGSRPPRRGGRTRRISTGRARSPARPGCGSASTTTTGSSAALEDDTPLIGLRHPDRRDRSAARALRARPVLGVVRAPRPGRAAGPGRRPDPPVPRQGHEVRADHSRRSPTRARA